MANQIVTVNVTQTIAPAPSTLQRTGAIISQGGTNTNDGTMTLLTSAQSLAPILETPQAITSMTWNTNVVTVTTTDPHGYPNGKTIDLTISGVLPAAYNGTYACTITGASTFTYAKTPDPGAVTQQGEVVAASAAELSAQVQKFFAQGSGVSVYVLELGPDDAESGVADLQAFLTTNPDIIYSFLVPDSWDAEPAFKTFLGDYNSTTAKKYFFVRSTLGSYTGYTDLMKCAYVFVNAPGVDAPDIVSNFWKTLSYNPSSSNLVPQLAFSFVYAVTPYPTFGNGSTLAQLKASAINYIGTGAEGGISNAIILWGTLKDGNPFNYWYSIDWTQINVALALANEVINGSNNPAAPLYYNQQGINRLQSRAVATMQQAVSYGLALGNIVTTQMTQAEFTAAFESGAFAGNIAVNAVPFANYSELNPSDYASGKYGGISIVYAPLIGFREILVNINATQVV